MKLFELNKTTYEVEIAAEALMLEPFKKLVDRDKSKTKETAKKELALLYHYCDVRSDYFGVDKSEKLKLIISNLGLPASYKVDSVLEKAIEFYKERSTTVLQSLYEGAMISTRELDLYLRDTKLLLEERSDKGGVVTSVTAITNALKSIPEIMSKLKTTEKELIKEQKETEGRMKGSKTMSMFEDGL